MMQSVRKTIFPWIIASAALLVVIAVSAVVQNRQANTASPSGSLAQLSAAPALPATTTGQAVQTLEIQSAAQPTTTNYLGLAHAYIQLIRETADTSYYNRVDELLGAVELADQTNAEVPALRATVALGKHDFAAAKDYAEQAIALAPTTALYYGLLADAEIELGNYSAAETALQTMVDIEPSFAAYSRIAYYRELHGDIDDAITAMEDAVAGGSRYPENVAWAQVEIGRLVFRRSPDQAKAYFEYALELVPEYPIALQWLGRVAYVQGDSAAATVYLEQAYAVQPLAQFAIDLSDLAFVTGDTAGAEKYKTLARITFASTRALGTNTNLEEAQFLVTRGYDVAEATQLARQAYDERPNIFAADISALALYQQGNITAAQAKSKEALQLGEFDPAIVYHAGLIAEAAGDISQAKAYYQTAFALSPNFSIFESPQLVKKLNS